eukprot:g6328.t1
MAVSCNMLKAEAGAISSAAPSGYRDMLLVHNIYRCLHDLPPLVWHTELAESAEKHLDATCGSTSCSGSTVASRKNSKEFALVGENIGSSTTSSWGKVVSRDWYEKQIVHADVWSEGTLPTELASDVDTPPDLTLRPGEEQPSF